MVVSKKKFFHVIISVLWIILFFSINLNRTTAGIFLLAVYAYAIFAWIDVTHKVSSMYFIFLLYCMLSNAGQTILYVFNIDYTGIVELYSDYSSTLVTKTLVFESICILMLSLGAILAYRENSVKAGLYKYSHEKRDWSDYLYIILYGVMFVSYAIKLTSRAALNYGDFFYGEGNSTNVDVRITILFYSFLFYSYWHHYSDNFKRFIYGSSLVLGVMMIVVGSRSLVIPLVFGLLYTRAIIENRNVKHYSIKTIIGYIILGIVGLYFLQVFKTLRGYNLGSISLSTILSSMSNSLFDGLVQILVEIGGSTRCITQTIKSVESNPSISEPTMLYAVLKMIFPVSLLRTFGIRQNMESLTVWVTTIGGGWAGTGAWGYSILAEAFFDMGQYGFILMLVFGYVWVMLERGLNYLIKKKYYIAGFALVYFLTYAIFLARAELALLASSGRYCLYILVISFIWKHTVKKRF